MPTSEVTLFVLCENRLLREALVRILGKRSDLRILGSCSCSTDALREVNACQPQIILLDVLRQGAGQTSLLRYLHNFLPAAGTVMVGMESKVEDFLHSVREGAVAFVLREASASEIVLAIRSVAAGQAVCPPCFSATLFRWAAQRLAIQKDLQDLCGSDLSRREQQVVDLLCGGLTNKEIALRLYLSQHTVRNHVHRILKKSGSSDRISLIDRYRGRFQPASSYSDGATR